MKKRLFSLLAAAMLFAANTFAQNAPTGDGSENSPYQIETPVHLVWLSNLVMADNGGSFTATAGRHFKLMNDIDMTSVTDFIPIGGWSDANTNNSYCRFRGTFDGNGHKITNLTINKPNNDYVGLFGYTYFAIISNLEINGSFMGATNVGGLIGCATDSKVNNCSATGSVAGKSVVGGLIGVNNGYGATYTTEVNNCYASVSATDDSASLGGLIGWVGWAYNYAMINCYATGSVLAIGSNATIGGLIGSINVGRITHCYAAPSTMTGTTNKKGVLIGYSRLAIITNCYYSSTLGIAGLGEGTTIEVTAKTDTELKTTTMVDFNGKRTTSLNYGNPAPLWRQDNMNINYGFPVLAWQKGETTATITYDLNDGSGILPLPHVSVRLDSMITISNSNGISKTGYTFVAWNTKVDGSGFWYGGGNDITATITMTLYAQWLEGHGTSTTPYLIRTPTDLHSVSGMVQVDTTSNYRSNATRGKCFKLMNDIDMSDVPDFIPIGGWVNATTNAFDNHYFSGFFDGNGRKITNLVINKPNGSYVGYLVVSQKVCKISFLFVLQS